MPSLRTPKSLSARIVERRRPWRAPENSSGPLVAVVGAGAAGLAVAAVLRRAGARTVNYDSADHIGGGWPTRYEALRLNTVRWMSDLPGYRMRFDERWVTRDQMTSYLNDYAGWHRLDVRLGVRVADVESLSDGRWSASAGGANASFDALVIATGSSHDRQMPDWPGAAGYAGSLLHSGEYVNPGRLAPGPVVIVGAGSSGAEIASDLVAAGRTVCWSIRTAPRVVPRELRSVPTTPFGLVGDVSAPRSVDFFTRQIERLAYGPRDYLPEPDESVMELMERCKEPLTADRIVDFVRNGSVEVVGPVTAFTAGGVVIEGGRTIDAPTVIAATGYGTGLRELVGHLDVLDNNDRPTSLVPRPGLGFVGYRIPLAGTLWAIGEDSRIVAETLFG